jgi:hypothetical protein
MEVGKLLAGTLTVAVEFTALQMQLNLNGTTVKIRNEVYPTGDAGMSLQQNDLTKEIRITPRRIAILGSSGSNRVTIDNDANVGNIALFDSGGSINASLAAGAGGGLNLNSGLSIIMGTTGAGYLQIRELRHTSIFGTSAPASPPSAGKFPVYNISGGLVGYVYLYSS